MATVKIATLIIRTLAKPISAQIKTQAKQHERFRNICVSLAQGMYRTEVKLRTNMLGEPAKQIRPLSETKAIENGANALAEGFLFSVAAAIIIGETWRSSRSQSKRRDNVDDQLDELAVGVKELETKVEGFAKVYNERLNEEKRKNEDLMRTLQRVVDLGLREGWTEFQDGPLRIPVIERAPTPPASPKEQPGDERALSDIRSSEPPADPSSSH